MKGKHYKHNSCLLVCPVRPESFCIHISPREVTRVAADFLIERLNVHTEHLTAHSIQMYFSR